MAMSENTQLVYRICVQGRLSQTGAAWFEGFTLTLITVQRMDERRVKMETGTEVVTKNF